MINKQNTSKSKKKFKKKYSLCIINHTFEEKFTNARKRQYLF
jgi:hypothetical protein